MKERPSPHRYISNWMITMLLFISFSTVAFAATTTSSGAETTVTSDPPVSTATETATTVTSDPPVSTSTETATTVTSDPPVSTSTETATTVTSDPPVSTSTETATTVTSDPPVSTSTETATTVTSDPPVSTSTETATTVTSDPSVSTSTETATTVTSDPSVSSSTEIATTVTSDASVSTSTETAATSTTTLDPSVSTSTETAATSITTLDPSASTSTETATTTKLDPSASTSTETTRTTTSDPSASTSTDSPTSFVPSVTTEGQTSAAESSTSQAPLSPTTTRMTTPVPSTSTTIVPPAVVQETYDVKLALNNINITVPANSSVIQVKLELEFLFKEQAENASGLEVKVTIILHGHSARKRRSDENETWTFDALITFIDASSVDDGVTYLYNVTTAVKNSTTSGFSLDTASINMAFNNMQVAVTSSPCDAVDASTCALGEKHSCKKNETGSLVVTCQHWCGIVSACGEHGHCQFEDNHNTFACACIDDFMWLHYGPRCEESSLTWPFLLIVTLCPVAVLCILGVIVAIICIKRRKMNSKEGSISSFHINSPIYPEYTIYPNRDRQNGSDAGSFDQPSGGYSHLVPPTSSLIHAHQVPSLASIDPKADYSIKRPSLRGSNPDIYGTRPSSLEMSHYQTSRTNL